MKVLIVVPVYNAEPMIHGVIADLLTTTELPVLVVDDGSKPPVVAPESPRLQVLRLHENQGKGLALRRAFEWANDQGYSHVLSFDGDGQHHAKDVGTLLSAAETNPDALVIGAREFRDDVPGLSRFGRRFSNFWVWYQTGLKVSDSQSGLRLYPLSPLENLKFYTGRYDFEIEVLVRLIWRGTPVSDVPVKVTYEPRATRVSHFNKLWDNARITGLNVLLIAYSLIFFHRGLGRVIAAGGLAFGAHLVPSVVLGLGLGIFACVLFRINVIVWFVAYLALYFF